MQNIVLHIECEGIEIFSRSLAVQGFLQSYRQCTPLCRCEDDHSPSPCTPGVGTSYTDFEDDGEGISTEDKPEIFTRGFGKNTGLGLFLSREILAITGITITGNGEPGQGARFEMIVLGGKWRSVPIMSHN